jgi:MFS family permease
MCQENLDRLLLVSTGFLLMFAAFNTAQNLTTKVMKDNNFGNLGYYSLAVHYFFFGICSFISAPVVMKLGPRLSMLFGAMTYSIFIAAFILPIERNDHPDNQTLQGMKTFIYCLLIFVAALNGIGASIIWVAQGKYLSECANETNKGLYMSIFQAFM